MILHHFYKNAHLFIYFQGFPQIYYAKLTLRKLKEIVSEIKAVEKS